MGVLLGIRDETEAERVETWKRQIATGPWVPETDIIGQPCQLCRELIWLDGQVRPGDNLSPALYRHEMCHEFEMEAI